MASQGVLQLIRDADGHVAGKLYANPLTLLLRVSGLDASGVGLTVSPRAKAALKKLAQDALAYQQAEKPAPGTHCHVSLEAGPSGNMKLPSAVDLRTVAGAVDIRVEECATGDD